MSWFIWRGFYIRKRLALQTMNRRPMPFRVQPSICRCVAANEWASPWYMTHLMITIPTVSREKALARSG